MKTTSFRLRIMGQVLPFLLIAPGLASAQTPPTRSQATAALNPANPAVAHYTRLQIDQLTAPIALYPDQLLSQVLMAATYPQQLVEAAQWLKEPNNAALKGEALVAALQPLPWDPSVKALVAFPQIIAMMNDHIEWTQALGVAFATQQAETMARVQTLRHLAMKSGRLAKLRHLAVRQEGPSIVIVPDEPDRVFVPVYNPTVVYGEWPDQGYPPVFIPPPPEFVAETIEPGIEVSVGFGVVPVLWGWSRPDWRANRITIDTVEFRRISRDVPPPPPTGWRHEGPVGLAQRAAAQPQVIQTQTTPTTQPGTAKPGQAQGTTTTTQPGAAKPDQAQGTTTTQPGAATPDQAQGTTTTTQPGKAKPDQAQGTPTTQPGTAKPGQAQTT